MNRIKKQQVLLAKLRTLILASLLIASPAAAQPDQITVNFESVPGVTATINFFDGCCFVQTTARLSNQLQSSHGVSFSSGAPYVFLVRLGEGHATSGMNGFGGVRPDNIIKYNSPVNIAFSIPGSPDIPAVTDFVSLRGDLHTALGTAKMEAFDVTGSLIGTVTALDTTGGLTLTMSQPNIHSVRITQTRSDIAFDDLKFNRPRSIVSQPPTADAGADQSIHTGQTVTLDGSASSDDNTSTENLAFAWTLTAKPDGSNATLTAPSSLNSQFTADLPGEYAAKLTVTDEDGQTSAGDTVLISSLNAAPVADAGMDTGGFAGHVVTLDGSASHDPDLDTLTYSWILTAPDGTSITLSGGDTAFPTFTPTAAGTYTATLNVSDPFGSSSSDSVSVSAILPGQFAADQIAAALNLIGSLSLDQVTNKGNRRALQQYLSQALAALQEGDTAEAIAKLVQSIERTDGCVLRGSPDGNGSGRDWIIDCPAQSTVYERLISALNALTM